MTTTLEEFLKPKFGALSVGDISQKGKARIAPIFDVKGKQIKLFLAKEPVLRTPWQVSSFDGGGTMQLRYSFNTRATTAWYQDRH